MDTYDRRRKIRRKYIKNITIIAQYCVFLNFFILTHHTTIILFFSLNFLSIIDFSVHKQKHNIRFVVYSE